MSDNAFELTPEEIDIIRKADDILKTKLDLLGELWTKTEVDWEIEVVASLTEPTCPCVCIKPEFSTVARYCAWTSGIIEGILSSAKHVYTEQILGKEVGHNSPITNPGDERVFPFALEAKDFKYPNYGLDDDE